MPPFANNIHLSLAWISIYKPSKMWDEITPPFKFQRLQQCSLECMNNFILHFDVITHPCWIKVNPCQLKGPLLRQRHRSDKGNGESVWRASITCAIFAWDYKNDI